MKLDAPNILLYIHPHEQRSETPCDDNLTLYIEAQLAEVMKQRTPTCRTKRNDEGVVIIGSMSRIKFKKKWTYILTENEYLGVHTCVCGERSTGVDFLLPCGLITNSLAAHYMRWHRAEVPQTEIDKITAHIRQ